MARTTTTTNTTQLNLNYYLIIAWSFCFAFIYKCLSWPALVHTLTHRPYNNFNDFQCIFLYTISIRIIFYLCARTLKFRLLLKKKKKKKNYVLNFIKVF